MRCLIPTPSIQKCSQSYHLSQYKFQFPTDQSLGVYFALSTLRLQINSNVRKNVSNITLNFIFVVLSLVRNDPPAGTLQKCQRPRQNRVR
jgi:hypothetical protein